MRTSLYSILCIGIRLAAVLLAVNALLALPAAYATFSRAEWGRNELGWMLALWTLVMLVALFFWVYPGVIARMAAGKASREVFESPINAEQLQYIAFSVVGLWIFASGLIAFAQLTVRELLIEHVLSDNSAGLDAAALRTRAISDLVGQALRAVAGSVLMLRARGLVGLLRHVRQSGTAPASDGEASDTTRTDKEDA